MSATPCPQCRAEIRVDLSRIPAGRAARVTCPGCQHQFPVAGAPAAPAAPTVAVAVAPVQGPPAPTAEDRAWMRRELDGLRADLERKVTASVLANLGVKKAARQAEDSADPELRNALVCEPDPRFAHVLCTLLGELGYSPQVVTDMPSAWRALDREWGLVTVTESLADEPEAGQKLQERLSRLPGVKRRRMFVVHVSNEVRSLDGGMAFVLNANVTLNRADAASAREILKKGLGDHERKYRLFHEAVEGMHE